LYLRVSNLKISNCTFNNNSADSSGGGIYNENSDLIVVNCILWGNTAPTGSQITGPTTINYSDIQGGWSGPGSNNIDEGPLFVDPNGADDISGTEDDNLRLSAGSLCIDAGDSNSVPDDLADLDNDGDPNEPIPWDFDGNPRFFDDPITDDIGAGTYPIVDMGAYEFHQVCGDDDHPYPRSDINLDCYVNLEDLALMAIDWLMCTAPECD
jgi:predicted outer membrane repeat protein